MAFLLFSALLVFGFLAYFIGARRAVKYAVSTGPKLHSKPLYHGLALAIIAVGPALLLMAAWKIFAGRIIDQLVLSGFSTQLSAFELPQIQAFIRDARALAFGGIAGFTDDLKQDAAVYFTQLQTTSDWILAALCVVLVAVGFSLRYKTIQPDTRARHLVEGVIKTLLFVSSSIAVITTIGIVFSLLFETINFFGKVSFFDFLFGMHWSPQGAFEGAGEEGNSADYSLVFGAVPLFAGTLLITFIAMMVAAPIGLMAAIYLSDYSSAGFRSVAKPILEILAGIPTVVYGFFAALTVAPAIRGWGEYVGLSVSSESALAAGLVMGIMIIPFVSSLSDDIINSVPQSLRDGSAALGATKSETIRRVILPAALPGIVSAMLLAISRAVGETMIVVMAAGLAANLTINPLEAVTTVTVQIVTLLVGDQEFDSAKTLAAFALGLVLFCITLILNIIALGVVRKYREQYD